jgi:hypothetical protein
MNIGIGEEPSEQPKSYAIEKEKYKLAVKPFPQP